jgi:hypothetical protein
MRKGPTPSPQDTNAEIFALVRQLHETEQRLQKLTGGEVDAVMNAAGKSYLLQQAQQRLRQSETLLRMAGHTARMGDWCVDLQEPRVTWSDEVCAIHEVPSGTLPGLEEAFNFYAPSGARPSAGPSRAASATARPST